MAKNSVDLLPNSNSFSSSDEKIWDGLKQAIALSSGFQSWQDERQESDCCVSDGLLDGQVRRYLRETLETLAY